MNKKLTLLVSIFLVFLFVFSGYVFANNEVKNTVNGATNSIIDGVENLGSDVRNGIGRAENGIEDAFTMDNTNDIGTDNNTNNTVTGTGDYTATTTAAGLTTTNNTSTIWVWITIAIAAIVIIGLVWYYGTQNTTTTHHDD